MSLHKQTPIKITNKNKHTHTRAYMHTKSCIRTLLILILLKNIYIADILLSFFVYTMICMNDKINDHFYIALDDLKFGDRCLHILLLEGTQVRSRWSCYLCPYVVQSVVLTTNKFFYKFLVHNQSLAKIKVNHNQISLCHINCITYL